MPALSDKSRRHPWPEQEVLSPPAATSCRGVCRAEAALLLIRLTQPSYPGFVGARYFNN
jgi:hypothetical protein